PLTLPLFPTRRSSDLPRPREPGEDDWKPAQQMQAGRHAPPAVDVDPDEDRLEEEREAFDREAEPEHAPQRAHEVRPQQTHLEARSEKHTSEIHSLNKL